MRLTSRRTHCLREKHWLACAILLRVVLAVRNVVPLGHAPSVHIHAGIHRHPELQRILRHRAKITRLIATRSCTHTNSIVSGADPVQPGLNNELNSPQGPPRPIEIAKHNQLDCDRGPNARPGTVQWHHQCYQRVAPGSTTSSPCSPPRSPAAAPARPTLPARWRTVTAGALPALYHTNQTRKGHHNPVSVIYSAS